MLIKGADLMDFVALYECLKDGHNKIDAANNQLNQICKQLDEQVKSQKKATNDIKDFFCKKDVGELSNKIIEIEELKNKIREILSLCDINYYPDKHNNNLNQRDESSLIDIARLNAAFKSLESSVKKEQKRLRSLLLGICGFIFFLASVYAWRFA